MQAADREQLVEEVAERVRLILQNDEALQAALRM
jgi:hypothetical protein